MQRWTHTLRFSFFNHVRILYVASSTSAARLYFFLFNVFARFFFSQDEKQTKRIYTHRQNTKLFCVPPTCMAGASTIVVSVKRIKVECVQVDATSGSVCYLRCMLKDAFHFNRHTYPRTPFKKENKLLCCPSSATWACSSTFFVLSSVQFFFFSCLLFQSRLRPLSTTSPRSSYSLQTGYWSTLIAVPTNIKTTASANALREEIKKYLKRRRKSSVSPLESKQGTSSCIPHPDGFVLVLHL